MHVHAIGDRAVTETLDAFEHARGERPNGGHGDDPRHQIAHLQLVQPEDVRRFAELGVTANMQALWACLDDQMVDLTMPFLGRERAAWQYPFGDLATAGAPLACGQRLAGHHARPAGGDPCGRQPDGVRRGGAGRLGAVPARAGDQPRDGVRGVHSGSSRVNHRDDAGVLRAGAVADLAVLDRDPFSGPTDQIGATRVVSTWIEECRSSKPDRHQPAEIDTRNAFALQNPWPRR